MSAPPLVAGNIVAGKYAVQGLLHADALASTYHAITAPHREVALKVFDGAASSADTLAALRRFEALTNGLPPSSVVHVIETGQDAQTGCPFSVTDLCDHPSLTQLVDLCPVSPAEAATMLKNLGRVVDLAHAAKTVHLGLKPNNLFVGPAPAYEVKVTDFGISGLRTARNAPEHRGPWMAWIAREQAGGGGGPAADVFASALVAFYAMTGRSYWRALTRGQLDFGAWERELAAPRTSVSARASELSLVLPAALDEPFARALADAPGARFPSVSAFAEAFGAALEGRGAGPAVGGAKKPAVIPRATARFGAPGTPPVHRLPKKTLIGIPGPMDLGGASPTQNPGPSPSRVAAAPPAPPARPAPPAAVPARPAPAAQTFELPPEEPQTEILLVSQITEVGEVVHPKGPTVPAPPRPAAGFHVAPGGRPAAHPPPLHSPPATPVARLAAGAPIAHAVGSAPPVAAGADVPPPPAAMMAIDPFAPPAAAARPAAAAMRGTQLGLGQSPSPIADLLAEAAAAAPAVVATAASPLVEEPERVTEPKFVVRFKKGGSGRWVIPVVVGGVVLLLAGVVALFALLSHRTAAPLPKPVASAVATPSASAAEVAPALSSLPEPSASAPPPLPGPAASAATPLPAAPAAVPEPPSAAVRPAPASPQAEPKPAPAPKKKKGCGKFLKRCD